MLIDIEWSIIGPPGLDDPLEARWVAMDRGLVDGQVTLFVMCIENFIFAALYFGFGQDLIQDRLFLVDALRDEAHEG